MRIQTVAPNDAARLPCSEVTAVGKNSKKDTGKKKSQRSGPSKFLRDAYEKVANDEIGRLGIVLGILGLSTHFLRRIIAPAGGMGGVTLSALQLLLFG